MSLDEAIAALESYRTVSPEIGNYRQCATGEDYICICSGGLKEEGAPLPVLAATPELAIALWHHAAMEYLTMRNGTLYWRCKPILDAIEFFYVDASTGKAFLEETRKTWAIYSRFIVTDKPPIQPQILSREAAE